MQKYQKSCDKKLQTFSSEKKQKSRLTLNKTESFLNNDCINKNYQKSCQKQNIAKKLRN